MITMTGGDGLAASLKALAASSRPSSSLCWAASILLIGTPVVETGGRERMVELISVEAGTTVEEDGCQEDDRTVEEGKTEETEEEAGAEKLRRTPARPDSTL